MRGGTGPTTPSGKTTTGFKLYVGDVDGAEVSREDIGSLSLILLQLYEQDASFTTTKTPLLTVMVTVGFFHPAGCFAVELHSRTADVTDGTLPARSSGLKDPPPPIEISAADLNAGWIPLASGYLSNRGEGPAGLSKGRLSHDVDRPRSSRSCPPGTFGGLLDLEELLAEPVVSVDVRCAPDIVTKIVHHDPQVRCIHRDLHASPPAPGLNKNLCAPRFPGVAGPNYSEARRLDFAAQPANSVAHMSADVAGGYRHRDLLLAAFELVVDGREDPGAGLGTAAPADDLRNSVHGLLLPN